MKKRHSKVSAKNDRYGKIFSLRMTPETFAKLKAAASESGKTAGACIRMMIDEAPTAYSGELCIIDSIRTLVMRIEDAADASGNIDVSAIRAIAAALLENEYRL